MISTELLISGDGVLKSNLEIDLYFTQVSINSREILKGSVFIGIIGEKFDGNKFYKDALDHGARCVVLDQKSQFADDVERKNFPYILVKDSLLFLQSIAKKHVFGWRKGGGKVICITGSNGKTTTKEMLTHLLKENGVSITSTIGNLNNHIGVPLTLLKINEINKFAVVEIGTNAPGEIDFLCELAQPDFGIITSIGASHLEKLMSLDGVYREKTSLFNYIYKNSVEANTCYYMNIGKMKQTPIGPANFVVDLDHNLKKITNCEFELNALDELIKISNSEIIGDYNFYNFALCCSIAIRIGLNAKQIEKSVSTFKPGLSRSEWKTFNNISVFCDYYNANPSSMRNSISAFAAYINDTDKSLLVLGDMYELGSKSDEYHCELGEFVKRLGFKNIVYIGKFSKAFGLGFGDKFEKYNFSNEFKLKNKSNCNFQFIFVKASRGVGMENIFIDD